MPRLVHFLRCIGGAVVKNGGRALASLVPFGDAAFEIARDACEEYRRLHGEDRLREEMHELVHASHAEVRHAAEETAVREATTQPPEVRLALVSYLGRLPATLPPARQQAATVLPGGRGAYALRGLLTAGDVADLHFARNEDGSPDADGYLVKVSRVPGGDAFLAGERRFLAHLEGASAGKTYREYLPSLVESFAVRDRFAKRANVFRHEPGFYTLEQVHAQYPALDARHLAWIFKRLLTVLGFCHRQGIVHAAVLPCHVLLHAGNHGVRLVGWGQGVEAGRTVTAVSTRYRDWYPPEVLRKRPAVPATDLFLAARCVVYLAGGDPQSGRMPPAVPVPLQRFLASCLLEGVRMRPDDAWKLLDELDELLGRLFGPARFIELNVKEGE